MTFEGAEIGKTSSTDTTVCTMYKHYYVISIITNVKLHSVVGKSCKIASWYALKNLKFQKKQF